jgi:hypothetical protein
MVETARNTICRHTVFFALLLAVLAAAAPAEAAILDNLVGYWSFDGNYVDSSNLQNAMVAGGTPSFVSGQAGQALSLNGSNWVESQNNVVVSGNQPRTLNFWMNASALQGSKAPTAFGAGATAELFDSFLKSDGTYGGHFYDANYDTFIAATYPVGASNPTYTPGTWTMATLVYSGGNTADVYRNGQFVKTVTMPGPLDTAVTKFYSGKSVGYAPSSGYTGAVDEVALWNRTLSAAEISTVYNTGQQGKSLLSTQPASSLAIQFDAFAGAGAAAGLQGPGHAAGVMKGTTWNEITSHFTGAVYNENGAVSGVTATVQFAGSASTDLNTALTNWGTPAMALFNGAATGWGGVYDTALTKDTVYVPDATGRNLAGTRVGGLPAGTYDVFWVRGTASAAMNVAIGTNITQLGGNLFATPTFQGSATNNAWVLGTSLQGGNYFRKRVTVSGPSDYIAVLTDVVGYTYNDFLALQIAKVDNPKPPTLFRMQFDTGRSVGVPYGPVGPGHTLGTFTGSEWNALGASSTGNYTSSNFVDENGNPLLNDNGTPMNVTVQIAANNGASPLSNWGSVTVADWSGVGGLTGINNTELMRDALYVSVGDRNVMGIRVGGLPMGLYEVLMMPKYAASTVQQMVSIGLNQNSLGSDSLLSPVGSSNAWVEGTDTQGGNYYRALVNISGPSDWITMIYDNDGITTSEFMGFQIARIGVPEPSSWLLLAIGLAVAGCVRRRKAT